MADKCIWNVQNLDCAACAATIEENLNKVEGVKRARVDYAKKQIHVQSKDDRDDAFFQSLIAEAKRVEPALKVSNQPYKEKHTSLRMIIRIILSALFFALAFFFDIPWLFLPSYLIAGYSVLIKAGTNLLHGKVFDENFLMSIATLGALAIRETGEASAVMLLYLVGEFFQDRAVQKSRNAVMGVLDLRADEARIISEGQPEMVSSESVPVGSIIRVLAGEKIPLDGTIIRGFSTLNMQSLTGESLPQNAEEGKTVLSGSVNLSGVIDIQTTRAYEDSTATKILRLVEESSSRKAHSEQFITTFARYYTPFVVFFALALAIIPSLITGAWDTWIYRSLVFLVVSCPCALVISVPLSYFAGIGKSASNGILVKGGNYLEALSTIDTMIFDKTGTLTHGSFSLEKMISTGKSDLDESYLENLAASLERQSNHPLARAFDTLEAPFEASNIQEIAGKGISALIEGKQVTAGNAALFAYKSIPLSLDNEEEGTIHLAVDDIHAASFILKDTLRADAKQLIQTLRNLGLRHLLMLSGDKEQHAKAIATELGLDGYHAGLLPDQKQEHLAELEKTNPHLAYVGDGMNDAPSLAASRVGIAMGSKASDAAIESADIVILSEELSKLEKLVRISKKTSRIVKQNIAFALGIKAVVLVLGALGYASMALAVFADTGVTIIAVFNALRILLIRLSR
nr:heavy metal translocating P-type ATPase [uncultured Sphaerochaeta sp.]